MMNNSNISKNINLKALSPSMYLYQSSFTIYNSIFSFNKGLSGGGIYILESLNNNQFYNCQFEQNQALASGGAILLNNSIIINLTDTKIFYN